MKSDAGHWSPAAQLEPDKTAFWLKLPGNPHPVITPQHDEKAIVIAVEIKPKGAVMPVGALVPPGPNRLKYRVNRFDAQQKFKAQGKQNWGTIDRPTGYHPRELYSGDAQRAAATLKELMKTPQNKLRAWEEGTMLFGAGSGGDGAEADSAGAKSLCKAVDRAGLSSRSGNSAEDLMDLVGELLAKEPLVSRLVKAQELDVLEVEGGGLVFKRLVALCGGSKDAALDLLERREADPFEEQSVSHALVMPEQAVAVLRKASLESLQAGTAVDGMEELYEKALKAVEELPLEDCVQLLRRYIIALGVMDCSVMMSLREVGYAEGTESSTQGDNVAGVIKTKDGRYVAYCVSVVDAGPKPPTKLGGKAKHESEIWEFVAGLDDSELV